jgi:2-isopropylmalate synthase
MSLDNKVIVLDTTMRDGELTPGVKMNVRDKIAISKLLEEIGVDIIEVGYPGYSQKDFDEILQVSKIIRKPILCGLASPKEDEIKSVASAIKFAEKGRIHTYTPVNIKTQDKFSEKQVLAQIRDSVSLSRNYCNDVEWSAFDATRSEPEFLCKAIEVAIESGATTVSIPDSLGLALPEEFGQLIQQIFNSVPNIDKVVISVHCHDDLGLAVENSIRALDYGARQIECSINGLGARKGNADLEKLVMEVLNRDTYEIKINTSLIKKASELVAKITGINKDG